MKKIVRPDIITDNQGRQRFHGAFTGGFSAGYFNTVGSEEGFQTSSYVSSRQARAAKIEQSVRSFMDEDDGLMGGRLSTNEEYDTFDKRLSEAGKKYSTALSNSSLIGNFTPDVMFTCSRSVGKEILRKLGWKDGQGVGARRTAPDQISETLLSFTSIPDHCLEDGNISLAPKDDSINHKMPPPKTNRCGVGFNDDGSFLGSKRLLESISPVKNASKILFSVKNDQDYDAYDVDVNEVPSMSLEEDHWEDTVENNNVPCSINEVELCPSDGKQVLLGFMLSSSYVDLISEFPHVEIPRSFSGKHVFPEDQVTSNVSCAISRGKYDFKSGRPSTLRGEALDTDSKFSFLSEKDRQNLLKKVEWAKKQHDEQVKNSTVLPTASLISPSTLVCDELDRSSETKTEAEISKDNVRMFPNQSNQQRPLLASEDLMKNAFSSLADAFKKRFRSTSNPNSSLDSTLNPQDYGGLQTLEEFSKTASSKLGLDVTKDLCTDEKILNSKTNSNGTVMNCDLNRSPLEDVKSVTNVNSLKKGDSRRHVDDWLPCALLCKRFNVPVISNSSSTTPVASTTSSYESRLFDQHIGQHIHGLISFNAPTKEQNFPLEPSSNPLSITEPVDEDLVQCRPSMSLFHSIFDDSDDDDDDDDDDDNDNEEKEEEKEVGFQKEKNFNDKVERTNYAFKGYNETNFKKSEEDIQQEKAVSNQLVSSYQHFDTKSQSSTKSSVIIPIIDNYSNESSTLEKPITLKNDGDVPELKKIVYQRPVLASKKSVLNTVCSSKTINSSHSSHSRKMAYHPSMVSHISQINPTNHDKEAIMDGGEYWDNKMSDIPPRELEYSDSHQKEDVMDLNQDSNDHVSKPVSLTTTISSESLESKQIQDTNMSSRRATSLSELALFDFSRTVDMLQNSSKPSPNEIQKDTTTSSRKDQNKTEHLKDHKSKDHKKDHKKEHKRHKKDHKKHHHHHHQRHHHHHNHHQMDSSKEDRGKHNYSSSEDSSDQE